MLWLFLRSSKNNSANKRTKEMEKEQILSTLTEKLGKTSISSRSLDTYISANLPADGTEPDDAYFEKHVNVLKSFGGQYSHDLASAIEDFKKNYKPNEGGGNGGDDRIAALEKQMADLVKQNKEYEGRATIEKMRSNILGKADELKISSYKNAWEHVANNTDLSDCKTEDEALTKCKGEFEKFVKKFYGDSAKPYGKSEVNPKHTEEESKKRREAYLESLRKSGKIPTKE